MNFNQQLAAYRKTKGISQENLADMLGVSRQAVSKWETGESQPEMGNLLAICRILQVSPNDLIGYENAEDINQLNSRCHDSEYGDGNCPEDNSNNNSNKGHKRSIFITLVIAAVCLVIGIAIGSFIGNDSSKEGTDLLEDGETLKISNFIFEYTSGSDKGDLMLTFIPSISNKDLKYEIVRIDSNGNTKTYPVEYSDGICTGFVELIEYQEVTFVAKVSDGERVISKGLFKVTDNGDNSYSNEEIWK